MAIKHILDVLWHGHSKIYNRAGESVSSSELEAVAKHGLTVVIVDNGFMLIPKGQSYSNFSHGDGATFYPDLESLSKGVISKLTQMRMNK